MTKSELVICIANDSLKLDDTSFESAYREMIKKPRLIKFAEALRVFRSKNVK